MGGMIGGAIPEGVEFSKSRGFGLFSYGSTRQRVSQAKEPESYSETVHVGKTKRIRAEDAEGENQKCGGAPLSESQAPRKVFWLSQTSSTGAVKGEGREGLSLRNRTTRDENESSARDLAHIFYFTKDKKKGEGRFLKGGPAGRLSGFSNKNEGERCPGP